MNPANRTRRARSHDRGRRADSLLRRLVGRCLGIVETVAFYLAIALPAAYGPILLFAADPRPAFYLLAVHAAAVVVGQGHPDG